MNIILRKIFDKRGVILLVCILLMISPYCLVSSKQENDSDDSLTIKDLYPDMAFSTFLGGSYAEFAENFVISNDGCYYITGWTSSADFPTLNAFNDTFGSPDLYPDAFITKFSSSGTLLWSTFFGGSDSDKGLGIAVASDGSCYVVGETYSTNFPILNAYNDTNCGSRDAFVAKFSTNGDLLWSTYLGGSETDQGYDIAVMNDGSCLVTGDTSSSDFTMVNAYNDTYGNGGHDAFIAKYSTTGTLVWSTFLGGSGQDCGNSIAVTDTGECYLIGQTTSFNFPTLNAYQSDHGYGGGVVTSDAFITKFSAEGDLNWSTYFGGYIGDSGTGIAVANDGSCFVTGGTYSNNFPVLNAFDETRNGNLAYIDGFVSRFSVNGELLWSTYLGGDGDDEGWDICVTADGNCFVSGLTASSDFPTQYAYDTSLNGGDAFISAFNESGIFLWSTFLGGSEWDEAFSVATDSTGSCHVVGYTDSTDFPTYNAYDNSFNGECDAFITTFNVLVTTPPTTDISPTFSFLGIIITLPALALILRKRRK